MTLYNHSLQILKQKAAWSDGEMVPLWQDFSQDRAAYLKRSGKFIHIFIAENGQELADAFTIGEVVSEGEPAEQFILNHYQIYAVWSVRLIQQLAVLSLVRAKGTGGERMIQ